MFRLNNFRSEMAVTGMKSVAKIYQLNSLNSKAAIIESSQLICSANQLSGFYMMTNLVFNELKKRSSSKL